MHTVPTRRSLSRRFSSALVAAPLVGAVVAFCLLAAQPAQAFELNLFGHSVAGSGKEATENRAVTGFDAVSTSGSIDVVVHQTGHEGVQLRGDDNLLPLIETTVDSNHTLVIRVKRGVSFNTHKSIVATVDVNTLKAVSSSGSGDITVETLKTPALAVSIAGSADAHLKQLDTDSLDVSVSGSGDVDGAGRAGKLKISVAGSGTVKMAAVQSDDVSVGVAGSGDADVTANKTLSVSVAGSGDVVYHGNATLLKSSIAGSGSVTKR
jgi:hypothetical protein